MNYRQWKKSYKKKHGYNPPIEVDKRKQVKQLKKIMNRMKCTDIISITKEVIARACEIIRDIFDNISKNLRSAEGKNEKSV